MSNENTDESTATEPVESSETATQSDRTEVKPTETVEFWKAKAREQEKRAKENAAAAKRVQELEDAGKTEAERAHERVKELEAQLERYEGEKVRAELRARVITAKNVPSEWADFVTGDSEDEMNAAADRILRNLGGGTGPSLHPTTGKAGGSFESGREAAKNYRP